MEKTSNHSTSTHPGPGRWRLLAALLVIGCLAGTGIAAEGPGPAVDRALQQSVAILGDSSLGEKAKLDRLRTVVLPLFDFAEMSRRSLGSHWRRRTREQREEFTVLFTRLLEHTYTKRISAYNGQRTRVVGEDIDDRFARVDTEIVDRDGRRFKVDYRMHRTGEPAQWRIYDVVIEEISLVNNYRAQFNRVINRKSFENLVERLRSQAG